MHVKGRGIVAADCAKSMLFHNLCLLICSLATKHLLGCDVRHLYQNISMQGVVHSYLQCIHTAITRMGTLRMNLVGFDLLFLTALKGNKVEYRELANGYVISIGYSVLQYHTWILPSLTKFSLLLITQLALLRFLTFSQMLK